MKICQVSSCFPPSRGGVESFVYDLSKRLVERGHEVKVITSDRGKPRGRYHEWVDGIEVIRYVEKYHLFEAPIIPSIALRLLREEYDILHVHGMVPTISDLALAVGSLRKRPKVLTYHYDAETLSHGAIGRLVGRMYANVARIAVRFSDTVVATTGSYARTSPVLSNVLDKTEIIPCGVDTARFSPARLRRTKTTNSELRGHTILYVGKLIHYKGVDNLIKAFKMVLEKSPNCHLIIAGDGRQRDDLVYLARKLEIGDKVSFVGETPDGLLPRYFRTSDLLVLPSLASRREAFGMVLLEAMASGIPVIASDIPGPDEVVNDEQDGLLTPPGNPEKLAEAIINLLQDAHRVEMGVQAHVTAKKYDWSVITDMYEDLYRSLVK